MLEALVKVALGQSDTVYGSSVWFEEYEKALGWVLVPIPYGRKGPRKLRWNSTPPAPIGHEHSGGAGLRHEFSGTCAIDIDNLPAAAGWLVFQGVDLEGLLAAPDAVRIESGRPGHGKLIYRLPEPLKSCRYQAVESDGLKHDAINFRCLGCQDVLPPSIHPDTGSPYRWAGDFSRVPMIPDALLAVWRGLLQRGGGDAVVRDRSLAKDVVPGKTPWIDQQHRIADALPLIDPDIGYAEWIKVMRVAKEAGIEWDDVDQWCSEGKKYPGSHAVLVHWNTFDLDRGLPEDGGVATPATIYHWAKHYCPEYTVVDRGEKPGFEAMFEGVGDAPVPPAGAGGDAAPLGDRAALADLVKGLTRDSPLDDVLTRVAHCRFTATELEDVLDEIKDRTSRTKGVLKKQVAAVAKKVQKDRRRERVLEFASKVDAPDDFVKLFGPPAGRLPIIDAIKKKTVNGGPEGDAVASIPGNVYVILQEGCGTIYPEMRRNTITGVPEPFRYDERVEYGGDLMTRLHAQVSIDFAIGVDRGMVRHAVNDLASRRSYSPFVEIVDRYERDETVDLRGGWFAEVTGGEDSEYSRAVGSYLICSLVERGYRPGCKMDSIVILEGEQGTGKSRFVEALSPNPDWYTDIRLRSGERLHETLLEIQRKVVIEVCELAGFNNHDSETMKKFFSGKVDHYRDPYAEIATDHPRGCIFVGTTNMGQYLTDPSGNRRYFPYQCGSFDIDLFVNRYRAPLYAAARDLFRDAAVTTWSLHLDLGPLAESQQIDRVVSDPWSDLLPELLNGPNFIDRNVVATTEILRCLVGGEQMNRSHSMRLSAAMVSVPGWDKPKEKVFPDGGEFLGSRVRGYVRDKNFIFKKPVAPDIK